MRICLATYEDRLAALLENAAWLTVYEVRPGRIQQTGGVNMPGGGPEELLRALRTLGVKLLICGAVTKASADVLRAGGIRLADWIGGETGAVLTAFQEGRLERMALPGRLKKPGRPRSPFAPLTTAATGAPGASTKTRDQDAAPRTDARGASRERSPKTGRRSQAPE